MFESFGVTGGGGGRVKSEGGVKWDVGQEESTTPVRKTVNFTEDRR